MAQLSKNAFLAKYNDTISGLFKAGQVAGIGSDDHRSLVQDIFDSMPFLSEANDFSVPFTRLFISSGATNWDWVNGYFSLALVEASADFDLNFTNQVLGSQGTVFIKKTVSGDVVVTIPTHQQVGAAGTTTTITLSGDDEQIFRVDFFKSETSSFNQVATTAVAFTKVQHLSSTVVLGFAGTTLYKSTDSGNTWSLAYTSPDDTIVDFDFDGVNGVLVSRVANGGNFDFNIFTSSNSGDTWSAYSVGSTLDLRNQDHVQKVIYYASGEYYTFGHTSVPDYRRITYRITSNTASSDQGNLVCMQIGNISRLSTDVWAVATRNDRIESFIIKRTGTNTWSEALDSPQINLTIRGIDFATSSLGIAVGNDSANDPAIIKSVDGGSTWTDKTIDTNIGILREVAAVSATSFIVIGDNGIGYSTDSGETWVYFATPNGGDALSAWDSDDILIASGTSVFKGFGSTIGDIFHISGVIGSGDVTGPASSTDENIPRFNGSSGKALEDSGVRLNNTFLRAPGSFSFESDSTTIKANSGSVNITGIGETDENAQPTIIDGTRGGPLSIESGTNGGDVLLRGGIPEGTGLPGGIAFEPRGGHIKIESGSNESMGRATLVAGTVTVNNTKVTSTCNIFLTSQVDGGTPGWVRVSARSAGTSFTITSSSGSDTSTISWLIIEEN